MVLSAITGIMLFIPSADVRARQLLFWSKLGFVAAGLVTTTMIRRGGFQENVKPVNMSGAARWLPVVSIVVWLAAITGGRFLAYFK
jgi:hypothetical protein